MLPSKEPVAFSERKNVWLSPIPTYGLNLPMVFRWYWTKNVGGRCLALPPLSPVFVKILCSKGSPKRTSAEMFSEKK